MQSLLGGSSTRRRPSLVPALSGALVLLLRELLTLLRRIGVSVGMHRPCWLSLGLSSSPVLPFVSQHTLRGCGVSGRSSRRVSASVRLVIHVRLHSVRRLGTVRNPRDGSAGDRHRGEAASAVARRSASSSTALGTSVRGLVDTDLSSVEPGPLD